MIEKGYSPEDIMNEISGNSYQHLQTLDLKYFCTCSREKFEKGLISLGKEQLNEIILEDKNIETVCHFCNTKYNFTEDNLISLTNEMK